MKKIFFFLFYIVVSISFGQTKKSILGYWEIVHVNIDVPDQLNEEYKKSIKAINDTMNETILQKPPNLGRYGIFNWLFKADNHLEAYYGTKEEMGNDEMENDEPQYRLIDKKGKEDNNGSILDIVLFLEDGSIYSGRNKPGPFQIVSISSEELVLTDMSQDVLESFPKGVRLVLYYKRANVPSKNIIAQDTIKSIKIGEQEWMVKNLNVSKFRNGDSIPEMKSNAEWQKAGKEGKPAWCYYNNASKRGGKYGKLYNWYAVNDSRGLAPEGCHIPTNAEYQTLGTAVSNNGNALKSVGQGSGSGAGTNTGGFSALLSGYRSSDGSFGDLGATSLFWSSTEVYSATIANFMYLNYNDSYIGCFGVHDKAYGVSVRCIKD
jgi:uncharacterized protein (TIGR02145 family)